jgi:hypothetical protein
LLSVKQRDLTDLLEVVLHRVSGGASGHDLLRWSVVVCGAHDEACGVLLGLLFFLVLVVLFALCGALDYGRCVGFLVLENRLLEFGVVEFGLVDGREFGLVGLGLARGGSCLSGGRGRLLENRDRIVRARGRMTLWLGLWRCGLGNEAGEPRANPLNCNANVKGIVPPQHRFFPRVGRF